MALLGHDVGVGGRGFGGGAEVADINLILAASVEDVFAEGILSDEAGGEEREGDTGASEVNQDVVRRAAGPFGLAADVGELFGLGIDINYFDLVNDPVAPREEAATLDSSCVFHAVKPQSAPVVKERTGPYGKPNSKELLCIRPRLV